MSEVGYILNDPCQPCERATICEQCDHYKGWQHKCNHCRGAQGLKNRFMERINDDPEIWKCSNCGIISIILVKNVKRPPDATGKEEEHDEL